MDVGTASPARRSDHGRDFTLSTSQSPTTVQRGPVQGACGVTPLQIRRPAAGRLIVGGTGLFYVKVVWRITDLRLRPPIRRFAEARLDP